MLDAALLVPPLLRLAVALGGFWMALPVLPAVIGVILPPLLLTIADDLAIIGVGLQLAAMIVTTPPSLTIRLAADAWLRATEARLEGMLTIAADPKDTQVTTPQRFIPERTL